MTTTDTTPSDVLIINHSPAVLRFIGDVLADLPCRIFARPSLEEPDADAPNAKSSDLLVLDYTWWADIDDVWAMLGRMRSSPETRGIPIILLSNRTREVVRVESRLKDLQITVVYKPIDDSALRAAVTEALDVDMRQRVAASATPDIRILHELRWHPSDHRYLFRDTRLAHDADELSDSESQDPSRARDSTGAVGERHDRVLRIRAHADLPEDAATESGPVGSDHIAINLSNLERGMVQGETGLGRDPLSG